MEWSEIDSGGWHVGECCWDYMSPLHLAWAYRDSSGVGNINPVNCIWMQNESGNRWPCEFGTCFSFRGLDTLNFQIIDQDTFVIKERHWSSSGTILLPMPIGNLRIYLVGDELRWDRIYGEHNVTEFCGGFGFPRIDTLTQIDMYDQFSATGWQHALDTLRARDLAGQAIRRSRKSIIARTRQPVTGSHTLELISRDYAAHCMVTPFVDAAGKSNFMSRTTSLGDTISYVSVPRDEDGFEQYSGNTGDFLADAWEEKVFPGTDLRKNWPFGHPDSVGSVAQKWEDDDYHMRGRAFDGDDLLNFEEYRGFLVAADSTQPHDTTNYEHIRCDPKLKDVFVYFHPELEEFPEVVDFFDEVYPGHIFALDSQVQVHITDNYNIQASSVPTNPIRQQNKSASFQRKGCHTLYPPRFVPIDSLVYLGSTSNLNLYDNGESVAQVISFWPWSQRVGSYREIPAWTIRKTQGTAFPHPDPTGTGTYPGNTYFIVVNLERFREYMDSPYCRAGSYFDWHDDALDILRVVVAHEFGHAVGLTHPQAVESDTLIMGPVRRELGTGRLVPNSPTFSPQDKSRFTVRAE